MKIKVVYLEVTRFLRRKCTHVIYKMDRYGHTAIRKKWQHVFSIVDLLLMKFMYVAKY